jgi:hexokinase
MSALEAPFVPNSPQSGDALTASRRVLTSELGISASLIDDADCLAAARISEVVGTRGCRLSACAIAATVRQTGGDARDWPEGQKIIFGLDGSLVEFYPRFEQRVRDALRELLGDEVQKRVDIVLAKDGSGVGGATSRPLALVRAKLTRSELAQPHCALRQPRQWSRRARRP